MNATVYSSIEGEKTFRDRDITRSRFYSISAINSQNYITASNQSLRIVPKYVTFSALRGSFYRFQLL